MTEILFYHLESAKLETVLPNLLLKCLERDWHCLVRLANIHGTNRTSYFDQHLWQFDPDSFLPHGCFGSNEEGDAQAQAELQPVWLTSDTDQYKGRDILFLIDGAEFQLDEIASYQRVIRIFDGAVPADLSKAREQWKTFKESEFDATYWRQSAQGKWEKQNV